MISGVEATVPLLGVVAPRCIVKQATVKRCVVALLLVSVASIFYYTQYVISSPLSRSHSSQRVESPTWDYRVIESSKVLNFRIA
ncbi:hypothetical protein PV326_013079 [Microctonus aethiopoides]|nr:hypothetical protein PV326_013079 [Microctonus aethiopoides]